MNSAASLRLSDMRSPWRGAVQEASHPFANQSPTCSHDGRGMTSHCGESPHPTHRGHRTRMVTPATRGPLGTMKQRSATAQQAQCTQRWPRPRGRSKTKMFAAAGDSLHASRIVPTRFSTASAGRGPALAGCLRDECANIRGRPTGPGRRPTGSPEEPAGALPRRPWGVRLRVMNPVDYLKRELDAGRVRWDQLTELVRVFQAAQGLTVDGKLGPISRRRLDEVAEDFGQEPPVASWPLGVDVSHHKRGLNWAQLRASGIAFVYIKATEGRTYTDPRFALHWRNAGAVELIRGAYHYLRPDNNAPEAEAENFIDVMGPLGAGDLPPAGDLEVSNPRMGADELVDWTNKWCECVQALCGRSPILYVPGYYWRGQLRRTTALQRWRLWVADLRSSENEPGDFAGWDWLFWQFSHRERHPGYRGQLDTNRFHGSLAQLRELARLEEPALV
ncbi:MAG: hypothetical protein B7733_13810 [Myxococcales bacterium FL481]|nr:MAG: hypothetical protein B7733_13810 [Myxococcales bacterium FL481]